MNIGKFLTKSTTHFPDNICVSRGTFRCTYRETNRRVNQLANGLRELGINRGQNVSLLMHNCPEFIEVLFACFKAGIGAVPINSRLHPNEYCYIIENSESSAVVLGEEFREDLHARRQSLPGVKHYVCLASPGEGMLDYEAQIAGPSTEFEEVDIDPDELAWLFYTSGTTGRPKGAMLTHGNLLAMTMNFFADMSPLGPEDAVLHAAPMSHGSGLYSLPNIAKGAKNVIFDRKSFEPQAVFESIQREKITNMFAAPTMIKKLVTSPEIGNYDLTSLKCLNYGGAPMYAEDLKEAVRKLGQNLVQLYGQAESPMTISYLRREEHLLEGTEQEMERLSSAGIPRTDLEVKIFDPQDRELSPGKMGEIVVRGEVVMKGYWKNQEATAEALRGGWLHTGDLGMIDENGYLYLLDRSKDMIISGGENIYPREVEEVIIRHPSVQEVAVIGVLDDYWGESVKAVVVLKDGTSTSEEEIIDFCKEHLSSYKKPKSVDFIDSLPKNNYGKVLKRELRDQQGSCNEEGERSVEPA